MDAFRSTLEEARYADIILHVVDASAEEPETAMAVVYETLAGLGIEDKPIITVYNKIDLAGDVIIKDLKAEKTVRISAKTGEGVSTLLQTIGEVLREGKYYLETVIPYDDAGRVAEIRRVGELLFEEYTPEGIAVKAYLPKEYKR